MPIYAVQMDGAQDYTLTLTISLTSQDIATNSSLVTWNVVASGSWGSFGNYGTPWYATIGGVEYSGTTASFNPNPSQTIVFGQTTIYHNAAGLAQIYVAGYWNSSHSEIGKGTAQGIWDLPPIPRASTPSWAGGTPAPTLAGGTYTLNTNRASSSFTHDITYTFGSASGTIGTGVGASVAWTIPLSLLNEIPNALQSNGVITTKTWNGATLIGSTTTGFTVATPTSVIPTWTSVTTSDAVSDVVTKVGALVQGISKISYAINGAAGVYGSTITQRRFQVDGQTLDGATGTSTTAVTSAGTVPATFTVTDSRGRQKTQINNLTVLPYSTPTVTSFQVERALSNGTSSPDNGTYLKVSIIANSASLINGTQKNTIGFRIYTKLRNSPTWVLKHTLNPSGISYNSNFLVTGPFDVDKAYDVRIETFDQFSMSAAQSTIAVASVFMHWGVGLGVGKYHELGALDVAGDIYQSGQVVIDASDVASETAKGIIELATQAEADAGTDTTRAITPAVLATVAGLPFRMAAGRGTSSSGGAVTITLPVGRFTQTPRVFIMPGNHVNALTPRMAADPTTTSFQVQLFTMPGAALVTSDFDWIAVQMTSGSGSG